MKPSIMVVDEWSGPRNREVIVRSPGREDVERAIAELDGDRKTLVLLNGDGPMHGAIGGGNDNQYVVYITYENETFWNATGSGSSTDSVVLTVGGQDGDYPGNRIVDRATAIKAALRFATDGGLDDSIVWEKS